MFIERIGEGRVGWSELGSKSPAYRWQHLVPRQRHSSLDSAKVCQCPLERRSQVLVLLQPTATGHLRAQL